MPQRFVDFLSDKKSLESRISEASDTALDRVAKSFHKWEINPAGTEGYAKAEVTVGGIDTDELSSRTMECKNQKGLFFIGEVVDVTGHLGGFDFQWAWSSGFVAGQFA